MRWIAKTTVATGVTPGRRAQQHAAGRRAGDGGVNNGGFYPPALYVGPVGGARCVLQPPYSMPETDLTLLLDAMHEQAGSADITCVQGAEDVYFYSTQTMTANYADMCVQVVENDICRAIAEAVRFDCRTYPRPYKVAMLGQSPYHFAPQQIAAALTAMETHPDYADIRVVEASNAEPYLFSERFMRYGKAYGLCEWLEVEQYQNP